VLFLSDSRPENLAMKLTELKIVKYLSITLAV
jgi:hypothetical protein